MPTATTQPAGPPTAETTYRVNPEAIVRYAGASGDFTSFHYDTERASSMGYDTLFAMGMLAAGHLCTLAAATAGAPIRTISFRFLSRSWVGHDVLCQACAWSALMARSDWNCERWTTPVRQSSAGTP